MSVIFKYLRTDDAGYRRILEVRPGLQLDRLAFDTAPHSSEPAAVLPREDVRQLRDALTEWLGDEPLITPEMLDERVREIVQDELRRIQVQGSTPIKARFLTEEEITEENWGSPCTRCTHSTGIHLFSGGCVHPDGCECAWPDSGAPAPEPARAPECECTHEVERHGPEAGCIECRCTWTGSAP